MLTTVHHDSQLNEKYFYFARFVCSEFFHCVNHFAFYINKASKPSKSKHSKCHEAEKGNLSVWKEIFFTHGCFYRGHHVRFIILPVVAYKWQIIEQNSSFFFSFKFGIGILKFCCFINSPVDIDVYMGMWSVFKHVYIDNLNMRFKW